MTKISGDPKNLSFRIISQMFQQGLVNGSESKEELLEKYTAFRATVSWTRHLLNRVDRYRNELGEDEKNLVTDALDQDMKSVDIERKYGFKPNSLMNKLHVPFGKIIYQNRAKLGIVVPEDRVK